MDFTHEIEWNTDLVCGQLQYSYESCDNLVEDSAVEDDDLWWLSVSNDNTSFNL